MKRVLLYARVSTADKGQDWQAQLDELESVAAQRGWKVAGVFHDETSGAKASRPGLDMALSRCRSGEIDIFAAVSVDRVARSVRNLLDLVDELVAINVAIAFTREGSMDTTTPQGRAFLQLRGVFAELERAITAERIREALAIRKARGVKLGRRRTLDYGKLARAKQLRGRRSPASWSAIARELGGSPGAWSRAVSRAS
jgi:DNA invertase Pin-like site-specific DNA recombinase